MIHKMRPLLVGLPLALVLGCSSNIKFDQAQVTSGDPAPASSANTAQFDPSAGVVPLPNILATATTTGISYAPPVDPAHLTAAEAAKVYVFPGAPPLSYVNGVATPSPKDSLAFLNLTEVGGLNAVAGLTSPIKLTFGGPLVQSSVTPATVKVYQLIPDADGSETGSLGFRDLSALFSVEWSFTWNDRNGDGSLKPTTVPLANGAGVPGAAFQLVPRLPLTPGSRYLYVVTGGVLDQATNLPVNNSTTFGFLKYPNKLWDYAAPSPVPPYTDASGNPIPGNFPADPHNPAVVAGAASASSLEKIRGNVPGPGGTIALSGYGKTIDDLIANAAGDVSGKAGAGATGISSRDQIKVMGRFITTGSVATRFLANNAATQVPVEAALWAWANNTPGTPFAGAPARQWSNTVGNFNLLASSTIPAGADPANPTPGSIAYLWKVGGLTGLPNAAVGMVATVTFESGDLNIDPAIAHAYAGTILPDGNVTGKAAINGVNIYNPGYYPSGASPVPGTGVLQGVRPDGNTLTGFMHVNRNVTALIITPAAAPAGGTYPVMIYQHGITSKKEDILTAANTICSAGYAVLAIDAPLHGALANGRPSSEWGANFMSLLDIPNTRTNIQQGAFNLWRLEKIAKESVATPGSLQFVLANLPALTASAPGGPYPAKPLATAGANKFVGLSLGTIIGSYFLAGNSNQYGLPGASNIKAFLSSPGAKVTGVIRDSQAGFAYQVNATLRAAGVAPGTHNYDQFILLVQSMVDAADPGWSLSPISKFPSGLPTPSRLSGRVVVQQAIGDTTIPNTYGNLWGNFLGGWGLLGNVGFDIAPGFTQVMNAGATLPTVPFMYGVGPTLKTPGAPATSPASGPGEGFFQFGTPAAPASHTMLLDFTSIPTTAAAQKQLAIWLLTGKLADPADTAHWPITAPEVTELPAVSMPYLDALK